MKNLFQRDHERMKATKEREEKLIISAWYELVGNHVTNNLQCMV